MSDVDFLFEVIREKIYQQFHYEIPYLVSQENLGWTELTDGTLRIDQYIFVEKESQQVCFFFLLNIILSSFLTLLFLN